MPRNLPIINRHTMRAMLCLLDWLYKKGVQDAYEACDDGLCREFMARTADGTSFGYLTDETAISWQEWCLRLMIQSRRTNWSGPTTALLNAIGRYTQNYLSVFFCLSILWYRMGVEHYISAPSGQDLQAFMSTIKIWWNPKGLKKVSVQDYVDMVQCQCFELERVHAKLGENLKLSQKRKLGILNPYYFDMFRRAVGLANRSDE